MMGIIASASAGSFLIGRSLSLNEEPKEDSLHTHPDHTIVSAPYVNTVNKPEEVPFPETSVASVMSTTELFDEHAEPLPIHFENWQCIVNETDLERTLKGFSDIKQAKLDIRYDYPNIASETYPIYFSTYPSSCLKRNADSWEYENAQTEINDQQETIYTLPIFPISDTSIELTVEYGNGKTAVSKSPVHLQVADMYPLADMRVARKHMMLTESPISQYAQSEIMALASIAERMGGPIFRTIITNNETTNRFRTMRHPYTDNIGSVITVNRKALPEDGYDYYKDKPGLIQYTREVVEAITSPENISARPLLKRACHELQNEISKIAGNPKQPNPTATFDSLDFLSPIRITGFDYGIDFTQLDKRMTAFPGHPFQTGMDIVRDVIPVLRFAYPELIHNLYKVRQIYPEYYAMTLPFIDRSLGVLEAISRDDLAELTNGNAQKLRNHLGLTITS